MTVYVDDAMIPAKVGTLDRVWCHLMADTPDELHAFAAQLGLKRSYFQDHHPFWHYDVTQGVRAKAIALGAQPVTSREAVSLPHWHREQPSPAREPSRCEDIACTEHPGDDPQALTGPEQADAWARVAREHWQAGRLAEAAAWNRVCRRADPGRAGLWQARSARLLEAATRLSLSEAYKVRLAVAGITAADPGLQQLATYNTGIQEREATA